MASDLHYTRDEVARLRDEATPGPWSRPPKGSRGETNTAHVYGPDCIVHSMPLPLDPELHHSHARWRADADLIAAAPALADDNLALHDAHAALREQADRMRDVLLALADACDEPRVPAAGGRSVRLVAALDRVLVELGALPSGYRTWADTAAALRALAEVPR